MSIANVRRYFDDNKITEEIIEFTVSSATVQLAAKALGVKEELIAKTLSFIANETPIIIVTAGDARIDNKKYKDYFKVKAKMLNPEQVADYTGHTIGGVCPFALKTNIDIYLDISLQRFSYVYPAAGSANSAVKITPQRLKEITGGKWVDLCKIPE